MIKRKTIGKIQVALGIVLIIGVIVGFLIANNIIIGINEKLGLFVDSNHSDAPGYSALTNESKLIIYDIYFDATMKKDIFNTEIYTLIISSMVIISALAFILIFGGLVNIIKDKK